MESSNVCMAGLEREMRFLVKEAEALRETSERVKGLEADNRELRKQAAIDQRTLATLREAGDPTRAGKSRDGAVAEGGCKRALRVQDLVNEKLKMQQRDNDLERLVHELEMKVLNQESARAEQEAQESRCGRERAIRDAAVPVLEGGEREPHDPDAAGSRCWSRSWSCR